MDDTRWAGAPPPYALEKITAPVLAISLEDDLYGTYAAARFTSAQVQRGEFLGFPTGGHIWIGHNADIWRAVGRFLQESSSDSTDSKLTARTSN